MLKNLKDPKKPIMFYYAVSLIIIMLLNFVLFPMINQRSLNKVAYSEFISMLEKGEVSRAYIDKAENKISFEDKSKPNPKFYVTGLVEDSELANKLSKAGVTYSAPIMEKTSPIINAVVNFVLPFVLILAIGNILSRSLMKRMGGMNTMQLGKSNARIYMESETGVSFDDVAGQDEAKEALSEVVDFLHNPSKYSEIGAVLPKGVLLVGPPGTGKTLLAKAVAGEAKVPFFSISGSEFVEMFVGMGAAKVRDMFKEAEAKAPCIVFIDEIDTIGKKREASGFGGNDEREQTLNQLLAEMDGFDGNKGVVILAATNRPEILDPALLRPGRFDRRVPVELPDLKGRTDILKVHIKKVKTESGIDLEKIAKQAAGTSGADLANVVNEAALRAIREKRKRVAMVDLEESIDVVLAGYQKKNKVLSDKEKLIVAYHEIGHALVAAMQKNSAPVHKITIIPRTSGALGFTMQLEEDEHMLMSKEDLLNRIAVYTGGRAAEDVIFNSITTGASNDIEMATKLARAMITRFGMSDEFGMVAFEEQTNQYLGGNIVQTGSSETASVVDKMVVELIKSRYEFARKILTDNILKLHELAKFLYEKETISGEEFMNILNAPQAQFKAEEAIQEDEK